MLIRWWAAALDVMPGRCSFGQCLLSSQRDLAAMQCQSLWRDDDATTDVVSHVVAGLTLVRCVQRRTSRQYCISRL
ncbi:hypothetical protein ACOSQ2_017230 [Xanthoceras sorbifolium]